MKIKELLKEFDPSSVNVGQDVGKDLNKGSEFVKNLTDPKRWLSATSTADKKTASAVELRDSLRAAASGKYYENDIENLRQVLSGVKQGTYRSPNPKITAQNLTTVINGGKLNKQGSEDLVALSNTFG